MIKSSPFGCTLSGGFHSQFRDNQCVFKKAIFVALGIILSSNKKLLGLWLKEKEGTKFWLSVLTELENLGVEDILITCIDGLKGFPEVIEAVYPTTMHCSYDSQLHAFCQLERLQTCGGTITSNRTTSLGVRRRQEVVQIRRQKVIQASFQGV